jgi:hypothetical protein
MAPPRSTSSKKRKRLLQSEASLLPITPKVPAVITQSSQAQPSQEEEEEKEDQINTPRTSAFYVTPSNNHTTTTNTSPASSADARPPSSDNNIDTLTQITFGTQSTPTKRLELDDIFTPLKKLFDHANDLSVDNEADESYILSQSSSESVTTQDDRDSDDVVDVNDSDAESKMIHETRLVHHPNFASKRKSTSTMVSVTPTRIFRLFPRGNYL